MIPIITVDLGAGWFRTGQSVLDRNNHYAEGHDLYFGEVVAYFDDKGKIVKPEKEGYDLSKNVTHVFEIAGMNKDTSRVIAHIESKLIDKVFLLEKAGANVAVIGYRQHLVFMPVDLHFVTEQLGFIHVAMMGLK